MRIGIDAIAAGGAIFASMGGVRTHLVNLLEGFSALAPENEYILFAGRAAVPYLPVSARGIRLRLCPGVPRNPAARVVYEQTVYPAIIRQKKLDVFLATHNVFPLLLSCPAVVIVQSLHYFYFPETFKPLRRAYLRAMVPLSLRRASAVIAVSGYEKGEIIQLMGIPERKITAIPHGVSPFWGESNRVDGAAESLLPVQRFLNGRPYILAVSTLFHFKNYPRLLEAFAILKNKYNIPQCLIVAGHDGDITGADLNRMAKRHGLASDFFWAGRVNAIELRGLYRGAELLVYPSLYETFGLPLLEAMASGCPVVAASASCLPEVGGNAVEWVDPKEPGSIAAGIYAVLSSPSRREELIRLGRARSGSFTWERTVRSTLEVIGNVYNAGAGQRSSRGT